MKVIVSSAALTKTEQLLIFIYDCVGAFQKSWVNEESLESNAFHLLISSSWLFTLLLKNVPEQ